jgi:hypothetical protein
MKRVFIVGCPRSGTTLLQTLLAANGRLVSPPETHFFNYLVPRSFVKYLGLASWAGRRRALSHMKKIGLDFRVPTSSWISDWSEALVECLDTLALAESANGWIEKTPAHLHFVDLIGRLIPDAQFVHVVRNGKDTCASLYEASNQFPEAWGGKKSARDCAERWVEDFMISERKIHDPRHKVVAYEKLVSSSEDVMLEVLEFLNVRSATWQLSEKMFQQAFDKAVLHDEPWKECRVKVEASTGKFSTVFDAEDQSLVESIVARARPTEN